MHTETLPAIRSVDRTGWEWLYIPSILADRFFWKTLGRTSSFQSAVPFDPVYLSGYFADKYDVSAEESYDRIAKRIDTSAFDALLDTVQGYETVRKTGGDVTLHNTNIKYAMYPVWVLNTTWRGQNYRFAMNGQTGKFVGDLPIDNLAYWKWRLLYGLGFAGVLYGAMWALGIL